MKDIVLILGAGLMQKPAILSAKELGFYTVVIDADDKAVSIECADEFRKIDLKNKEEILDFAKELQSKGKLEAVFTAGTDFSASVSYVCENLGLNAHSFEVALNASDKTRMRDCFEKSKVPSPNFFRICKDDLSENLLKKINSVIDFPIVVKPVDNMGARGCRMVRNEKEFLPAVSVAIEVSRTGYAIVEEYMEGPEYSIDALVYNGTMTITGFAERHIYYPPYFIEMGHTMPAILDKEKHDQLISVFALGVKALGLSSGAAKADIKFTKNGPMIGEIAGRLSGGYMSGWTYPYASGLNLTKEALKIACNKVPDVLLQKRIPVDYLPSEVCKTLEKPFELFEVPCKKTSAERAWISIPGKVKYIENIQDYTDQAIYDVLPRATVSIGSNIDFPRNNVQKCGNVIAVSFNHELAITTGQNEISDIFITLEPNNVETENFLNNITKEDEEEFPPSAFGKISQEDLDSLQQIIKRGEKISKNIPKFCNSAENINKKDWNYNTILDTAVKFDLLRSDHPDMDCKKFWKALFRGGIQAAVYFADSNK